MNNNKKRKTSPLLNLWVVFLFLFFTKRTFVMVNSFHSSPSDSKMSQTRNSLGFRLMLQQLPNGHQTHVGHLPSLRGIQDEKQGTFFFAVVFLLETSLSLLRAIARESSQRLKSSWFQEDFVCSF